MKRMKEAAQRDFPQNFVDKFVGHEVDDTHGVFTLRVRWMGFGPEWDTDEPIHNMVEDVPHMVEDYLHQHADDEVCARYLQEYFE